MKVLIADDDALIRESLKIILELEDDIEVVGIAENGQEAFSKCSMSKPDIVLMDIRMPVLDGVLGTKLIKENFPDVKVVLLTTFTDEEYIKEALKCGAEGYMLKSQSPESIINSLRAVSKGTVVFQQDVIGTLKGMLSNGRKKDLSDMGLNAREMEILKLISDGMTNKEIAETLFLSEGTVRNYITGMLEKLCLRDRTQLAIMYLKNS